MLQNERPKGPCQAHHSFKYTMIILKMLFSKTKIQIKNKTQYINVKYNKNIPVRGPVWPSGWVSVKPYFYITAALELGEWLQQQRAPHFTPRNEPVPILQDLGGPQGLSWRAKKLIPTGNPSPSSSAQPVATSTGLPGPQYKILQQNAIY